MTSIADCLGEPNRNFDLKRLAHIEQIVQILKRRLDDPKSSIAHRHQQSRVGSSSNASRTGVVETPMRCASAGTE